MTMPSHVLLYVDDLAASTAFYTEVLGEAPVSATASFVLFEQEEGVRLGLWARECVEPASTIAGGGAELVIVLDDEDAVDSRHDELQHQERCIVIQPPLETEYGRSFVLLDPDGHRVRIMMPF
ncbi:VOC family protein [Paludibacterium purpuratum]|uniref:Catechol 2,3-dioxygenase-like lactoylglutathione lyase family enzyme n=1 Tax=Paludibacterium purpuratum TaxID=1144873 RepID=A0A4V6PZ94_9NEIS|nr:VOC family protein [Paludibacterium purpuratum]TDR80259.1 catechol 2,3-dioxygenase-like lactoylglutathione lyase family enzyme [Paludibacterium purpuratum]